jgi:hypothetical protein
VLSTWRNEKLNIDLHSKGSILQLSLLKKRRMQ